MAPNDPTAHNDDDTRNLTFYPAFCFKASPTHFTWVKMGASDIHRLMRRVEFGDQGLFFYKNHPIRFVNLVGIIVARADVPRRTIITIDDSSGATVDVVTLKRDSASASASSTFTSSATVPVGTTSTRGNVDRDNVDGSDGDGLRKEFHVTSTTHTPIDITPLQPGRLFQIKGTLSVFRSTMQVHLERFFTVPDTNAEMRFVEARCRFLVEVLSVPWFVGEEDIAALRLEGDEVGKKVEEDQEKARRRKRRRVEREERDTRNIEKLWEREEAIRKKEARRASEAGVELMRRLESRRSKKAL
ncbi:OB-fold domain-containing protein [Aspergillus lucknowensis]|uniref:CST complex subunit Stn1 N-terminal domain-containing protein n=1 Tax=Aspergillus lucknowensis TaxID=176173 RepID=A0ABR4M887_9EURO